MSPTKPYFDELREDPEWVELERQAQILQQPPWSFSGKWVSKAVEAIKEGRVRLGTPPSVVAEIIGQEGDTYTITGNTCNCPARRTRKDCYHPTAAELYRLYHGKLRVVPGVPSREPGDDEDDDEGYIPEPEEGSPLLYSTEEDAPLDAGAAEGLPVVTVEPSATAPPKANTQAVQKQKQRIRELLVTYGLTPTSAAAYEDAVETHVGLSLVPEQFGEIITRLEQMVTAKRAALPSPKLLKDYMVDIKGKQHIQYAGLLAYAHEQGLTSLQAEFVSVTTDLAIATAKAVFKDGRVFWESGDATPSNVAPHVKPHFARMALTRAKARVLRDALNIGIVAAEELE